ncbi:CHC2 zinc finger domain-containing protein, partial [Vibrio sp. 10N.222.49.F1]|uniref:CHC2 zinc finger domain-containing protein n=1 Tax=Vibrio sp. 10N.222.49.F1 TaxID=3229618 RepID=UPI00354ED810
MAFIPSFIIDEIKSKVNIIDILEREIGLSKVKKINSDDKYQACCPFHDDKTPSLVVNNDLLQS